MQCVLSCAASARTLPTQMVSSRTGSLEQWSTTHPTVGMRLRAAAASAWLLGLKPASRSALTMGSGSVPRLSTAGASPESACGDSLLAHHAMPATLSATTAAGLCCTALRAAGSRS